jgi:hypothetical protein
MRPPPATSLDGSAKGGAEAMTFSEKKLFYGRALVDVEFRLSEGQKLILAEFVIGSLA